MKRPEFDYMEDGERVWISCAIVARVKENRGESGTCFITTIWGEQWEIPLEGREVADIVFGNPPDNEKKLRLERKATEWESES